MAKLEVIKVMWLKDEEVHMDVPDSGTWWARSVPDMCGGTVWELNPSNSIDEPAGYYESPEDVFEWIGDAFNMPLVIAKDYR